VLADVLAQRLILDPVMDKNVHPLRDGQFSHGLGESRLIAQGQVVSEQGKVNVRSRRKGPHGAGAEEHNPFDFRIGRKRFNDGPPIFRFESVGHEWRFLCSRS
jgi:hypothetical protein